MYYKVRRKTYDLDLVTPNQIDYVVRTIVQYVYIWDSDLYKKFDS